MKIHLGGFAITGCGIEYANKRFPNFVKHGEVRHMDGYKEVTCKTCKITSFYKLTKKMMLKKSNGAYAIHA